MVSFVTGSEETFDADIRLLLPLAPTRKAIIIKGREVVEEIKRFASSLFFDPSLVLVLFIREPGLLKEILAEIESLKDLVDVIVYATFLPPQGLFDFPLNSIVMERDKGKRFEQRVRFLLRTYGKKMTKGALELLKSALEDETSLDQEVMKCINFVGEKEIIEMADVEATLVRQDQPALSGLLEALAKRDKKGVLLILDNLLAYGFDAQSIQSYLLRHLRLVLQAKDAALPEGQRSSPNLARELDRWKEQLPVKPEKTSHYLPYQRPFYAYKLMRLSQQFSSQRLYQLLESLIRLEVQLKGGAKNERVLLEEVLLTV